MICRLYRNDSQADTVLKVNVKQPGKAQSVGCNSVLHRMFLTKVDSTSKLLEQGVGWVEQSESHRIRNCS
jgi:hypothetical protein